MLIKYWWFFQNKIICTKFYRYFVLCWNWVNKSLWLLLFRLAIHPLDLLLRNGTIWSYKCIITITCLYLKKPIRCNPKYSINSIFVRVISLELYVCITFSLVGILAAQDQSLSTTSTRVAKMTEGGWQLWKLQQAVAPMPQCLTNLSFSIRPYMML